MYKIVLKEGKEKQLLKHHPWVFSGAIDSISPQFTDGDWAEVISSNGLFVAYGWYDEKSHIILHLLSWNSNVVPDEQLIAKLVRDAVMRRKNFFSLPDTTAFRLIHGEADFIPGLAVDAYASELRAIISSRFANRFIHQLYR